MGAFSTATSDTLQATSRMGVLLPALLEGTFDYAVPAAVPEGTLVEVPLGKRSLIGVVWNSVDGADAQGASRPRFTPPRSLRSGSADAYAPTSQTSLSPSKTYKLKPVTRVIDDLPPLAENYRRWLDWISEFTLAPKGAVLSLCGLAHAAKTPKKALTIPAFTITLPTLTEAQQKAADHLKKAPPKPILLDGVTGSGKTEVYFHAMAEAMARGEQVLVLLPEIALTHQWFARFEQTFGAAPCVWHSRMTPVAKARAWQAVARGAVPVVVGARSALFLPFKNLGLIIVDEEHDPSYKQEDGVLYHARDMAVVRAHFEQIPIVLASATPSLETLENVKNGKY